MQEALRVRPLEDIRLAKHPAGVMLSGRWLDRAELDRGLTAIEGKVGMLQLQ